MEKNLSKHKFKVWENIKGQSIILVRNRWNSSIFG